MNSDLPSDGEKCGLELHRAFIPVSTVHEINGNFPGFLMDQWSQDRPGATQFPLLILWTAACFLAGVRWQVCGSNNGVADTSASELTGRRPSGITARHDMPDDMHGEISPGLEHQQQDQCDRVITGNGATQQDHEVHGNDARVGKEHE